MIIHNELKQGTPEWDAVRCTIPTASEFSKLITSTGAPSKSMVAYAYYKACEKFAGQRVDAFDGNVRTEAGTEDEPAARDHYAFTTGRDVQRIGFVTDDEVTCGCSPDSFADDGLLELKRLKGNLLVEMHLYYKKHGKLAPSYVPQVQGQMMICERKWCDVVFYNPLLPSLIVRVEPDEKVIAGLKAQIKACNELRDKTLAELGW